MGAEYGGIPISEVGALGSGGIILFFLILQGDSSPTVVRHLLFRSPYCIDYGGLIF